MSKKWAVNANEFWQRNVTKTMIYRGEPKSLLYFMIRKQLWANLEAGQANTPTDHTKLFTAANSARLEPRSGSPWGHVAKSGPPVWVSNCSNCSSGGCITLGYSSAQLIFPQIDCVNGGEQIKNKEVQKETKTKHLIEKTRFPLCTICMPAGGGRGNLKHEQVGLVCLIWILPNEA